jgi:hypothetical protein
MHSGRTAQDEPLRLDDLVGDRSTDRSAARRGIPAGRAGTRRPGSRARACSARARTRTRGRPRPPPPSRARPPRRGRQRQTRTRRAAPLRRHPPAAATAPSSRDSTWDVITQGEWGSDVHRIDQALAQVFATYPVDPSRLAISGFSDGAPTPCPSGSPTPTCSPTSSRSPPDSPSSTPGQRTPRLHLARPHRHGAADRPDNAPDRLEAAGRKDPHRGPRVRRRAHRARRHRRRRGPLAHHAMTCSAPPRQHVSTDDPAAPLGVTEIARPPGRSRARWRWARTAGRVVQSGRAPAVARTAAGSPDRGRRR